MESIMKMLPSVGPFAGMQQARGPGGREAVHAARGDHQLDDAEGAAQPRNHFGLAPQAHRAGSGTSVQDVNQLLRQYAQMSKMFKQMGKGGLAKNMMRGGLGGHGSRRPAEVWAVGCRQ